MRKFNFITAIAIAVAILFSACNKTESENTVNNDQNQTEVEDSDYTYNETTNTYTVYTAAGLLAWNVAVQDDLELNCTLAADIDLTDIDWTSTEWLQVGYYNDEFDYKAYTGTFEGSGYTIKGLTIDQEETDYVGLIGYLNTLGRVQNLMLDNVSITGSWYVGGVVGYNNGTVTNCGVSGRVSGSGRNNVGGVVGYNDGTVIACSASCNVSGNSNVGGVVGYNSGGTVIACSSSGNVTSSEYYVGGVLAWNLGTVIACYHALGNVDGSSYVGGVMGGNYGTVTACYWSNYEGNGIDQGSGEATLVDGTEVIWSDAVTGMNNALETNQSDWRYELLEGNDYPTLTKSSSSE